MWGAVIGLALVAQAAWAVEAPRTGRHPRARARVENRQEAREKLQEKAGGRVDQRQENQARRIEHGVKKGYLTDDEVAKLQAQQKSIADLEASFKADGRLSRDEFKSLRQELNTASRCIWAEKHDTDGGQMPVFRLGRNVYAKAEITDKLADESLSREEARALLRDFHRLVQVKHLLATGNPDDRDALQAEFNELLNKYFEYRAPAAEPAK
jgi:hypothetical protein